MCPPGASSEATCTLIGYERVLVTSAASAPCAAARCAGAGRHRSWRFVRTLLMFSDTASVIFSGRPASSASASDTTLRSTAAMLVLRRLLPVLGRVGAARHDRRGG